jgi:hypothetical protein
MNSLNTRRVMAPQDNGVKRVPPQDNGACGYIGGSGAERKEAATDSMRRRMPLEEVRAKITEVVDKTARLKAIIQKAGPVAHTKAIESLALSLAKDAGELLNEKELSSLTVGSNGSKTDAYTALLLCRAELNGIMSPNAGASGAV